MKKTILITFFVAMVNLTFAQNRKYSHDSDTLKIPLTDLVNKRFIKIGEEIFKINISIDKMSDDSEGKFDLKTYIDTTCFFCISQLSDIDSTRLLWGNQNWRAANP